MTQALGNTELKARTVYSPYPIPSNYFSPEKRFVSEAEYWEKYYDYPDKVYEWHNGYLEEKPVSDFSTILMSDWFSELLGYYLKTRPIAKKTFLEMGFSFTASQKDKTRRPDFGIILNSNPVSLLPTDRSYKGIYDICIEAISDSTQQDITRDIFDKKIEYAIAGVKEYYIFDGQARYTQYYALNANSVYIPIKPVNENIIQSTVLPGFQFRIDDLYNRPLPEKMIDDPIYQGFVLPGYTEEKRARKEAEQRAEQAKNEAQKERQRAEQLAEKLRALGIDPDN